ncbi:MAG: methyl-accepting chemotaxis protein [Polyangia bacterium]
MAADNFIFENRTLGEAKLELLRRFHIPVQKWVLIVVGGVGPILYGIPAIENSRWQDLVMLAGLLVMLACWGYGLFQSRRGRLEIGVGMFVASVIAFETLEMLLFHDTEGTAVLGNVAVTIYAAMYNRRYLYAASGASLVSLVASELVKFAEPWNLLAGAPAERLIMQLAFGVLLIGVIVVILRRWQRIDDTLFGALEERDESQRRVIESIRRLRPVLDEAVGRISEISSALASQAAEQAAATTEVSASMESVRRSTSSSAEDALEARRISTSRRQSALESTRRLEEVRRGFDDAIELIEESREEVGDLARQAESIEEILEYNREIGEQIKILAINAAVQAAKAGEYGAGFRVVASELRSMIGSTDENLTRSRKLLDSIRSQARDNVAVVEKSTGVLRVHFDALTATAGLIGEMAESFVETADRVGRIADSAQRQESNIDEVSTAVDQISTAAEQLERSGGTLLGIVQRITASHRDLESALEKERSPEPRA